MIENISSISVSSQDDLVKGLQDLQDCGTITVSNNFDISSKITLSKRCTIDLGNRTLTASCDTMFYVPKDVDVIITNGNIESSSNKVFQIVGTQANPSSIKFMGDVSVFGLKNIFSVQKNGKVIVDGSNIVSGSDDEPVISVCGKNSVFDLVSGKISSTGRSTIISVSDGGKFVGSRDGKVVSSCETECDPAVVIQGDESSGFITCDSSIESKKSTSLVVSEGAQFSIEDGHVISRSDDHSTIDVSGNGSKLNIIGGSVESINNDAIDIGWLRTGETNYIDIVGGSISGSLSALNKIDSSGDCVVSLSGGYYEGNVFDEFIPDGKVIVDGYLVDSVDPEPEPDPEPESEPEPDPEPESKPDPEPDDTLPLMKSFNVKRSVCIYRTPSEKYPIMEHVGSVRILSISSDYCRVRIKLPGSDQYYEGYIKTYKLR